MANSVKITIASFFLAAVCWITEIVFNPSGFEIILAVAAVLFSVVFVCFLAIRVAKKLRKNISAYKVFAIADICVGCLVAIYAVYDIKTDTGWFAGLLGVLLLLFVIPVILLLLAADFILWRIDRSRKKKRQDG